jgi:ribosomal protein S12 methylthiotransferase
LARNREWVGKEMTVLIEGYSEDGRYAIGRSHRDAPEVDGLVYVRQCNTPPGEFVAVQIEQADVYDLLGVPSGILSPLEVSHGKRSELSGRSTP